MKLRITAESREGGQIAVLARPRSLAGAARRLLRDGEFWDRWGWEGIALEVDDGSGWRMPWWHEIPADLPRELRAELRAQAKANTASCPHCGRPAASPSSNLCGPALMGRPCR